MSNNAEQLQLSPRLVVKKLFTRPQQEGNGAVVRRSIGRSELKYFDPFLVLDEFTVSPPFGFPDHPHRGFETVTYMLQGAMTHEDFTGNRGTIRTGDVQWMTVGRGIVHSEMPSGCGTHRGLQLWINLSSHHKMIDPKYEDVESKDIVEVEKEGIRVRIISGEAMGRESPVYTRTPVMYLDLNMQPEAHLRHPIPPGWNAFVYVIDGEGVFGCRNSGGEVTGAHHDLLLLGSNGDGVEAWNESPQPLRFILVAGEPLKEAVAQFGPFVMNTEEEIDQTIEDFQNYANGFEMARSWSSTPTSSNV